METVQVNLGSRTYPIFIGDSGSVFAAARLLVETPQKIVAIADATAASLHVAAFSDRLGRDFDIESVPPGEQSKSLEMAGKLYEALARRRVERADLILTFGGGVVGDLGGFVAATWLRGIPFIQVPTTLLAAVDASVGGKTAVNHPAGKNLIGAFYQPEAVLIGVDFLQTLPERNYRAGLAESVKHALIAEAAFLEWQERHAEAILTRSPEILTELIARNCRIKASVVSEDEREAGLRAILNFGHTIGHALEHLLEYELQHGECVALGMLAANGIAEQRGMLDAEIAARTRELLVRFDLPQTLPRPVDPATVVELCRADKKVRAGAINFILLKALGQPVRVADVREEEIRAAVTALHP